MNDLCISFISLIAVSNPVLETWEGRLTSGLGASLCQGY